MLWRGVLVFLGGVPVWSVVVEHNSTKEEALTVNASCIITHAQSLCSCVFDSVVDMKRKEVGKGKNHAAA